MIFQANLYESMLPLFMLPFVTSPSRVDHGCPPGEMSLPHGRIARLPKMHGLFCIPAFEPAGPMDQWRMWTWPHKFDLQCIQFFGFPMFFFVRQISRHLDLTKTCFTYGILTKNCSGFGPPKPTWSPSKMIEIEMDGMLEAVAFYQGIIPHSSNG